MFTSLVHKNAQVFTQKLPFGISFHESLHVPSSKTAFSTDEFTKVMSGQKRQKSNQIMYAYIYIYIYMYVLCIWTYISIKWPKMTHHHLYNSTFVLAKPVSPDIAKPASPRSAKGSNFGAKSQLFGIGLRVPLLVEIVVQKKRNSCWQSLGSFGNQGEACNIWSPWLPPHPLWATESQIDFSLAGSSSSADRHTNWPGTNEFCCGKTFM